MHLIRCVDEKWLISIQCMDENFIHIQFMDVKDVSYVR
jgi:hypothetical protein